MNSFIGFFGDMVKAVTSYKSPLHSAIDDAITSYPELRDGREGTTICRWCSLPIEYNNGVWWQAGTCGSVCEGMGPAGPVDHQPVEEDEVPVGDRIALERWLNS